MAEPISDLNTLLSTMEPRLNPGVYIFCVAPAGIDLRTLTVLASFLEPEGLTLVMKEEDALSAGLPVLFRAAWITLTVHSDLQAVGLTGAFATALAEAGISCNVLAAAYHDHIFVPVDSADKALETLYKLQKSAANPS